MKDKIEKPKKLNECNKHPSASCTPRGIDYCIECRDIYCYNAAIDNFEPYVQQLQARIDEQDNRINSLIDLNSELESRLREKEYNSP